ncbi:MAG: AtpZ/AtpI family protein [Deltaproteobacteria bacterium]|nr:AtpZ/AtpI family protein [Deltaproteobacteria bacterium]
MADLPSEQRKGLLWMAAGFEFGGLVIGGVVLGWWLDQRFALSPWGIVSGLLLGSSSAFYRLWMILQATNQGPRRSDGGK